MDELSSDGSSRVLIHCSAAISRSPAVVTGYLIRRRGMSLGEGLKVLKGARGRQVNPNKRFMRQLEEIEREREGEGLGFDNEGEEWESTTAA
ncbi:hypothetical protein B0H66DRAFT_562138 [Apodospora peruviana]|uniref:protein-tyrosine-phosphatase n=1 Tax=Apodospora peruviana TaxID=516989 RepID=A0AAE0M2W1_9PEZI|nr:hypothetical protein B0H66DRAFT_562138 [Apodospora peruviana]